MKPFSKNEIIGVGLIILVVFGFSFQGLKVALRRARDAQRQADLGTTSDALHKFYDAYGFFPPSEDGRIKACKGDNFEKVLKELGEKKEFDRTLYFSGLKGCIWGQDSFRDILDETYPAYLSTIPSDPMTHEGISYLYFSNTRRFQLYAYLEGERQENTFNEAVSARNLPCGSKVCSYGRSFGDTPLDISIEEYELELEKSNTGNF